MNSKILKPLVELKKNASVNNKFILIQLCQHTFCVNKGYSSLWSWLYLAIQVLVPK